MPTPSLRASAIFNMSFGQVFVVGQLRGQPELVRAGLWRLFINGKEVAELEAVGEQLPGRALPDQKNHCTIAYKGRLDTITLDLSKDEILLLKAA